MPNENAVVRKRTKAKSPKVRKKSRRRRTRASHWAVGVAQTAGRWGSMLLRALLTEGSKAVFAEVAKAIMSKLSIRISSAPNSGFSIRIAEGAQKSGCSRRFLFPEVTPSL
jgi:hypothetical protein